jgi:hypothetical protein
MEMEVACEDRTAHRAAGFDGMGHFIFLNQVREHASPFKKSSSPRGLKIRIQSGSMWQFRRLTQFSTSW